MVKPKTLKNKKKYNKRFTNKRKNNKFRHTKKIYKKKRHTTLKHKKIQRGGYLSDEYGDRDLLYDEYGDDEFLKHLTYELNAFKNKYYTVNKKLPIHVDKRINELVGKDNLGNAVNRESLAKLNIRNLKEADTVLTDHLEQPARKLAELKAAKAEAEAEAEAAKAMKDDHFNISYYKFKKKYPSLYGYLRTYYAGNEQDVKNLIKQIIGIFNDNDE